MSNDYPFALRTKGPYVQFEAVAHLPELSNHATPEALVIGREDRRQLETDFALLERLPREQCFAILLSEQRESLPAIARILKLASPEDAAAFIEEARRNLAALKAETNSQQQERIS